MVETTKTPLPKYNFRVIIIAKMRPMLPWWIVGANMYVCKVKSHLGSWNILDLKGDWEFAKEVA
jgi:hypothetical protein